MIPQIVIDVIGWIYFGAWSLSFYGQFLLNFRLKNVQGMNLDFLVMNLTGFTFYSLYCSYGYFNPAAYTQTGQVDLNDLIFAYHAVFITILTCIQAIVFPKGKNKILKITFAYLIIMWIFCMVYGTLTLGTKTFTPPTRLGVISLMGYFKLSISFLKYLPQMYWNYKRKSTVGWSIANILLDFTGGFFSFLQMALEAINGKHIQINPVKLVLAIMCMIYDIIFMIQHYCLYPQKKELQQQQPSSQDVYKPLTETNQISGDQNVKISEATTAPQKIEEQARIVQEPQEPQQPQQAAQEPQQNQQPQAPKLNQVQA